MSRFISTTLRKIKLVFASLVLFSSFNLLPYQNVYAEPLVPQEIVDQHLKSYSVDQKELIQIDLNYIQALCFHGVKSSDKPHEYVATAGGPGASKSTILERYIEGKHNYAYIDPDQRALVFMMTYKNEFTLLARSKNPNEHEILQLAYQKWRGASNYIATTLLNAAFEKKYNIVHGTTSTSPEIGKLYEKLVKNDYKITLLLCYSTDENRVNAIDYRAKNQHFVQSSHEDVVHKGKMFPKRLATYFQYADKLLFYWTEKFQDGSVLAATLVKGNKIEINNQAAYDKFVAQYDKDRNSKDLKDENLKSLQILIDNFDK